MRIRPWLPPTTLVHVVVPFRFNVRAVMSCTLLVMIASDPLSVVAPVPFIVPILQVEAPDTTTLEEPLSVPPERSSVLAAAPPELLKVKLPPLRLTEVTVMDWTLLKTPAPLVEIRAFPR